MVRISIGAIAASVSILLAQCAAQEAALLNEVERASNDTLLWGPYKPNLYFGVRPRIPKSLAAGLLWVKADNFKDVQNG
jgi:mannosyl-oligosaccharide glucosidase